MDAVRSELCRGAGFSEEAISPKSLKSQGCAEGRKSLSPDKQISDLIGSTAGARPTVSPSVICENGAAGWRGGKEKKKNNIYSEQGVPQADQTGTARGSCPAQPSLSLVSLCPHPCPSLQLWPESGFHLIVSSSPCQAFQMRIWRLRVLVCPRAQGIGESENKIFQGFCFIALCVCVWGGGLKVVSTFVYLGFSS